MQNRNYSREELIRHASLSDSDIEQVKQCRRDYNRLGFGYQIGFVRLENRFPTQQPLELIPDLLTFTSVQLQIDENLIAQYQKRRQTISEHQIRILDYLKLQRFEHKHRQLLSHFLFEESCRLEQTNALLFLAEQFLRDKGILRPATSTLERIIGEQRTQAQQHIFERITNSLKGGVFSELDSLLVVGDDVVSPLQRLKAPPGAPSPAAMEGLMDKLARIQETGILDINLSWLNNNYQRALAAYVRQCNAHRLREVSDYHRYGATACFLWQTYQDTIDFAVDLHDKLITKMEKRAKAAFDIQLVKKRKSINKSLSMFQTVGEVILDGSVADEKVRQVVFNKVEREELAQQISQLNDFISGKQSHQFHHFVSQFNYLRKFSPTFLKHLKFGDSQSNETDLILATELLKEMNTQGKRKLPDDTPTDFVKKRLRPIVIGEESINKHAWESALVSKIRDEIKSGNLSVKDSKRFGPFDRFFISDEQWQTMREDFFQQSGLPQRGEDAAEYLKEGLSRTYDQFFETLPGNTYARIEGDRWHLSVDSAEPLPTSEEIKLEQFKEWLKKHQRKIKLPQLLIEVDNELHFTRHFLPPYHRNGRPVDEICAIIAAVMANGCNIGPDTMAQLTSGVVYQQIKRITDWQLTQETQRSALAVVVNAIANLSITR